MKKNIDIFGTKFKVLQVDKIPLLEGDPQDLFYWGLCDHDSKVISIATKNRKGKEISNDDKLLSLLHEVIHAFLGEGLYHAYNNDEPLVEWLAKCFRSMIKLKVHELG